jgi:hypothetical protein
MIKCLNWKQIKILQKNPRVKIRNQNKKEQSSNPNKLEDIYEILHDQQENRGEDRENRWERKH